MVEQGRSTLTPDESGRVLDRLAGLEQVISPESVRQALSVTGRCSQRACRLTHEVTLWIVLAMGILTDLPIRQVFKHARRLRVGEDSPHRSSLCVARNCLSEHLPCNFREFLSMPVGLVHGGRQLERGPVRRSLPPVCSHSSHAATCGNVHLFAPGRSCRYLRKVPLT